MASYFHWRTLTKLYKRLYFQQTGPSQLGKLEAKEFGEMRDAILETSNDQLDFNPEHCGYEFEP